LRARAPRLVSRATLAGHFEVNPRTVERDVLALQQAGVPIWTQRGRGGGYAIDSDWTLPPLNFDATEALAVIAALTAARSMPFADAGRRAEQKLLAAMRRDEAAKARELAGRMRLAGRGTEVKRPVLAAVETAVVERRVVDLEYEDRDGTVTRRPVEAHGLHMASRASYLIGWCLLRGAGRAFRLDRIAAVRLMDEIAPERDVDALLDWVDETWTPEVAGGTITMAPKDHEHGGRGRPGGPARHADDRSGATPAFARAVALSLPAVEEPRCGGKSTLTVKAKPFLVLEPDEWMSADATRVHLPKTSRDEARAVVEQSWRRVAPKRVEAAYRRRPPGITFDHVRDLALALPGVEEEIVFGHSLGFCIGGRPGSGFARIGPPIGNLLPPDDDDTMLVRRCAARR